MTPQILVPLDGSLFAEQAVPLATSIARRLNARLMLARVHEPFFIPTHELSQETAPPIDRWQQGILDGERAYLDQVSRRVTPAAAVDVDSVLLHGDAIEALDEYALESDTVLAVMCTHGRGGIERAWLGSVADEFVRRASVPVLLIRPVEQRPPEQEVPAPTRFLIPLEGSATAETILESALTIGGDDASSYALVRVVEDPWSLPPREMESARAAAMAAAEAYLKRVAEWLRSRVPRVTTKVLAAANVALAIMDEASAVDAHVIAMATHGRHGLARVTRGSVADKVTRLASIPVLLLRPQDVQA